MLKTYSTKASDIKREWHLVDASDKILGRLYVVVINAEKIRVTGNKAKQKFYYRHSGYPGGLKSTSLERMMQTHPTRVIEHAVKGMLPHNRLEAGMMKRLRIFAGDAHPYGGQIKSTIVATEKQKGSEEPES